MKHLKVRITTWRLSCCQNHSISAILHKLPSSALHEICHWDLGIQFFNKTETWILINLKRTRKKLVVFLSQICFRNKISQHIIPSTVLILVTISSNFWLQNDPQLSSWRPSGLLIDAYQINLVHPGGISRQAITKFSDFLACSEKCCTALSIERKKGTSRISRDALRVTGTAPVFNRIDPRKKDEPDEPFKSRQLKACLPGGQEFCHPISCPSVCQPLLPKTSSKLSSNVGQFCCNQNEDAFPRKCP